MVSVTRYTIRLVSNWSLVNALSMLSPESLQPLNFSMIQAAAPRGLSASTNDTVSALCSVARVAGDLSHELVPEAGHGDGADRLAFGLGGKTKAGQRRDHDVEGVPGRAAEARGVGERADGVEKLDYRAGPAVRENDGRGAGAFSFDMEKVDVEILD